MAVAVKAYDKEGNFVGRWDNKTQAAEATGAEYHHISEIINHPEKRRFTAGGLYWFKEDTPEDDVMDFINIMSKNHYVWGADKKVKTPRIKLTEEEKKERRREYYLKNREKIIEYGKNYYKNKKKNKIEI